MGRATSDVPARPSAWPGGPAGPGHRWPVVLRRRLRDDAATWNVPGRAAEAVFALPLVAAVVVAVARVDKRLFRVLTGEDGILEWLQVLGYLAAALFGAALGLHLFRQGRRVLGLLFLGGALGCVFVVGEEISWGQRIFGLATPEALNAVNEQGEVNVHNIQPVQMLTNAVQLVLGVLAALAPWVLATRARGPTARFLLPPLFLSSAFAVIAVWRALRFMDVPRSSFTVVEYGELPELCLAAALGASTVLVLRRDVGGWTARWSVALLALGAVVAVGSASTAVVSGGPGAVGDGTLLGVVEASAETAPVPHADDAADDPAIWVDPGDPSRSTLIGTDKQGGLAVYDLAGRELQYIDGGKPNNVDLRDGFPLGGRRVSLVAAGNRRDDTIAVYAVDERTRRLEDVSARPLRLGIGVHGVCLYRSPTSGRFYFFGNSDSGQVEQWELYERSGRVEARRVRSFELDSETEGCVADDEYEALYISEEGTGVWRYGAEPSAGARRNQVDWAGPNRRLAPDVEGIAVAHEPGGGFLVVSSQGNDSFAIYRRTDGNAYVGSIRIGVGEVDGVEATDGIDVTTRPLGPAFALGTLVVQDGDNGSENQNFKLVPWEDVARLLPGG
jgi:3-phytase